jgi:predicted transcriptional regulator
MWIFSDSRDTDFGEDDSSGVRFQPDHFPNTLRPGGGYHKDTIVDSEKPAVFCNKCDDEMVDGSCVRCDWGEQNRAVPMPNYPLDPFRDDKAGIRAGSWHFAGTLVDQIVEVLKNDRKKNKGVSTLTNAEIAEQINAKPASVSQMISQRKLRTPEELQYQQSLKRRPRTGITVDKQIEILNNPEYEFDKVYQQTARDKALNTDLASRLFTHYEDLMKRGILSDEDLGVKRFVREAVAPWRNSTKDRLSPKNQIANQILNIIKNNPSESVSISKIADAFLNTGSYTDESKNTYQIDQNTVAYDSKSSRNALVKQIYDLVLNKIAEDPELSNFDTNQIQRLQRSAPVTYSEEVENRVGPHQSEILNLIEKGRGPDAIANSLNLSPQEVRAYLNAHNIETNIPEKTEWRSIFQKFEEQILEDVKSVIDNNLNNSENLIKFDYDKWIQTEDIQKALKAKGIRHFGNVKKALHDFIRGLIESNSLLTAAQLKKVDEGWFGIASGKVERTEDNYVYFIQSPTSMKIGWTGHLPRRMQEHDKANQIRKKSIDPTINQMIYNLEEGIKNDVPGAVLIGPIEDWRVATNTENQIKKWLNEMGWEQLSEDHGDGFSEARYNYDPEQMKGRFPVEAMSELMRTLITDTIRNGGSVTGLSDEEKENIQMLFGYDNELLNKFFNTELGSGLGLANDSNQPDVTNIPAEGMIPDPVVVDPNITPLSNPFAEDTTQEQRSISPYETERRKFEQMILNGTAVWDQFGNLVDANNPQNILWGAARAASLSWEGF